MLRTFFLSQAIELLKKVIKYIKFIYVVLNV